MVPSHLEEEEKVAQEKAEADRQRRRKETSWLMPSIKWLKPSTKYAIRKRPNVTQGGHWLSSCDL